jgi:hypothetical protein
MCVGALPAWTCPLECGKLNVRSLVLVFVLKTMSLIIYGFDNVIIIIVNKSNSTTRSIFSLSSMTPSIRS